MRVGTSRRCTMAGIASDNPGLAMKAAKIGTTKGGKGLIKGMKKLNAASDAVVSNAANAKDRAGEGADEVAAQRAFKEKRKQEKAGGADRAVRRLHSLALAPPHTLPPSPSHSPTTLTQHTPLARHLPVAEPGVIWAVGCRRSTRRLWLRGPHRRRTHGSKRRALAPSRQAMNLCARRSARRPPCQC